MSALFACTKCHSRHPFEELSQGEQLCQVCRNNFPVVKCTYCRVEFQQGVKGSTNSLCKKCAQNVRTYGKPSACEYCNVIAAFIGNKCQRCANSEKKWGNPQTCEQCKQQCAFDRSDESRRKVDGKLLCWLCTLAYKRVLAKTRKRGIDSLQNTPTNAANNKGGGSSASSNNSQPDAQPEKNNARGNEERGKSSKEKEKDKEKNKERSKEKKDPSMQNKKSKSSGDSSDKKSKEQSGAGASAAKKPRLEKTGTTNGMLATPAKLATTDSSSFMDLSSTDNMIAITQLKEEVEQLKKQLQAKDLLILEKEKKLTELKAQNYESEKDMRVKLTNVNKQFTQQIEELQIKNRELQKQVSTLSKNSSKKNASSPS